MALPNEDSQSSKHEKKPVFTANSTASIVIPIGHLIMGNTSGCSLRAIIGSPRMFVCHCRRLLFLLSAAETLLSAAMPEHPVPL
jgi:hypothetical protein